VVTPATTKATFTDLVGQAPAKRLEEKGITTTDHFLRKASKLASRQKLAKDCMINEDLLLHWAYVMELTRINQLGIDHVVLMEAGGVDSLDILASKRALELQKLLERAKEILDKELNIPEPIDETLEWWIEQAQKTPSHIEK